MTQGREVAEMQFSFGSERIRAAGIAVGGPGICDAVSFFITFGDHADGERKTGEWPFAEHVRFRHRSEAKKNKHVLSSKSTEIMPDEIFLN